jgi:Uma2 family endonuclease
MSRPVPYPLDDDTAVPRNTTRAAEGLPRRRFTIAEIEAFVETGVIPEEERFEMIGGEIVPMSPRGLTHEWIKMWLLAQLVLGLPRPFATNSQTTLRLSDDTFLEPDFVVFERATGLERLNGATCLLAIEIGLSSLCFDRGRKAGIYAAFGVRELWVIDGRRRETRVFREPGAERLCVGPRRGRRGEPGTAGRAGFRRPAGRVPAVRGLTAQLPGRNSARDPASIQHTQIHVAPWIA